MKTDDAGTHPSVAPALPRTACPLTPAAFAYLGQISEDNRALCAVLSDLARTGALDGLRAAADAGLAYFPVAPPTLDQNGARQFALARFRCVLLALNHPDPAVARDAGAVADSWRSRAPQIGPSDLTELVLDVHKECNYVQMRSLVRAGAKLNPVGRTPLYVVLSSGDDEAVEILLDALAPLTSFPPGTENLRTKGRDNIVEAACALRGIAASQAIDRLRALLYPRLAADDIKGELDRLGQRVMDTIGDGTGTLEEDEADTLVNMVNAGAYLPAGLPGAPAPVARLLAAPVWIGQRKDSLLGMVLHGRTDFESHTRFLATLLADGAIDVDMMVPGEDGLTLLQTACFRRRPALVRLLLETGADASRPSAPMDGKRLSCIELCRKGKGPADSVGEIVPLLQAVLARQAIHGVTGAHRRLGPGHAVTGGRP